MKRLALIVLATTACFQFWAGTAAAACPEFAKISWWTTSVPEVTQLVETNYQGNWDAYIARWKQQRETLRETAKKGGSVEIKSRNLVIAGDNLKKYITLVDQRIATLECLKQEVADRQTANFATAAGGPQPTTREASLVQGKELSLDVAPVCQNGVPGFQVTNLGERWPHIAEVILFRTDTDGKISLRRVRMINSQQMLFKVPESEAKDVDEAAIFVKPSWYQRAFAYDARSKC